MGLGERSGCEISVSKKTLAWTIGLGLGAIVIAVIAIIVAHRDSHQDAKPVVPTNAISSSTVTATGSGAGPTTASAANGQGNASFGGGQSGQGNIAGQGNTVNSPTGDRPVMINAQPGSVVNVIMPSPALTIKPTDPPKVKVAKLQVNTAKGLIRGGQNALAAKSLKVIISSGDIVDPLDLAKAHNDYGVALAHLKKYNEALIEYNEALRLDPNNPLILNNKGDTLSHLGNYKDATESFEKALMFPVNSNQDFVLRRNLDIVMTRLINQSTGIDLATLLAVRRDQSDDFVKAHPDMPNGYMDLFECDKADHRLPDMQVDIRNVAAHHPKPGQVAFMNGDYWLAQYDLDKAIHFFALAAHQGFNELSYVLWANCEYGKGNNELAISLLQKAISRRPKLAIQLQDPRMFTNIRADPRFQALLKHDLSPP